MVLLLENETFIGELSKLFANARSKGSVVMTLKKYDGRTKPIPKDNRNYKPANAEPLCLIRARSTKNKSKKISTIIHQKDIVKFQIAYFALIKSNFDGLKKAKKVKKSKAV